MNQGNLQPKTRIENIVVQEMNKELLIYDLKDNKAFCLNETSAIIYQLCDGTKTIAEISQSLTKKSNQPISEDVIWLALDDFKKDKLLEHSEQIAINFNGLNRRQIIKKIGFSSMIVLPMISAVMAPQAAQAASCVGVGQSCSPSGSIGNCCSGQSFCFDFTSTCESCYTATTPFVCSSFISQASCNSVSYKCCSGSATLDSGNVHCMNLGFSQACVCN